MDAIKITSDNELDISFEEIKDIVKETIDEAKNLNNLIETVCKRIYFKGVRDGEIKIHKILTKDQ